VIIIGLQSQPRYDVVQDAVSGEWLILEDGRTMARATEQGDALFLAQSAGARRAALVQPIGPMLVIRAGFQN